MIDADRTNPEARIDALLGDMTVAEKVFRGGGGEAAAPPTLSASDVLKSRPDPAVER